MGVRLLLAGLAVLGTVACAAEPTIDVSALRVTAQDQQLEAHYARLSPDGERMLYYLDESCVRRLNGSGEHCVDEMNIRQAAWSPDGRRIAFTEGLVDSEPDIWVLNVETGQTRNLTDDDVEISRVGEELPTRAKIDVLPSWTPDGEHIRFARKRNDRTIELSSVPAGGGEVTRIRTIRGYIFDLLALEWAGYTVAWVTLDGKQAEVWLAGPFAIEGKRVLQGKQTGLSFAADGKYLLAFNADQKDVPPRVVPVMGGDPIPVATGRVAFPTWAPEGHALAFLDADFALRVVDEPGGTPRKLTVDGKLAPVGDGLSWAPGKLLLTVDGKPTVLTITG